VVVGHNTSRFLFVVDQNLFVLFWPSSGLLFCCCGVCAFVVVTVCVCVLFFFFFSYFIFLLQRVAYSIENGERVVSAVFALASSHFAQWVDCCAG